MALCVAIPSDRVKDSYVSTTKKSFRHGKVAIPSDRVKDSYWAAMQVRIGPPCIRRNPL